MTAAEEKINALFEELVPDSGKANTVAGEIVRAITRIGYRNFNDGDHIGVGYGRETCNPAARYLIAKCGYKVEERIDLIWGDEDDRTYDKGLTRVEEAVLEYLDNHPELKEEENDEDMWDYKEAEDMDDTDYDEDYYDDEEDGNYE